MRINISSLGSFPSTKSSGSLATTLDAEGVRELTWGGAQANPGNSSQYGSALKERKTNPTSQTMVVNPRTASDSFAPSELARFINRCPGFRYAPPWAMFSYAFGLQPRSVCMPVQSAPSLLQRLIWLLRALPNWFLPVRRIVSSSSNQKSVVGWTCRVMLG
jgi:hypothetical protein